MYAITASSYRAIVSPDDILPGETFADEVPESVLTAIKAKGVRFQRDALLLASDWTQGSDSRLSEPQKAAWATYREALRAIPDQPGFPEVQWPATPGSDRPLR